MDFKFSFMEKVQLLLTVLGAEWTGHCNIDTSWDKMEYMEITNEHGVKP